MLETKLKRIRHHKRIRARIWGTKEKPRFCAFKSSQHIYGQLINDDQNKTILAVGDQELKLKAKLPKIAVAKEVGKLIAEEAKALKIEKVVFDRGGFKYHGRIKSLADGAREAGLKF